MQESKLPIDYNKKTLQIFTPCPDFIEITAGNTIDSTNILCFCVDDDTNIYFNGNSTPTYTAWPAHQVLGIASDVKTITFGTSCTLMYMKK